MKLISVLLLLAVVACGKRKLTGYIVCKKYIPKHMCCSEPNTVVEATIMPHVHHVHHHEAQDPRWILYVSNSCGTTEVDVTKNCYKYFKLTDKVSVYGDYVELIKEGCR
jgi:hypothetical protein